jgi:hypothetical protein
MSQVTELLAEGAPARPQAASRFGRIDRGALIIIGLFLLLLPLSTPRIYATDEVQYYAYLRSVYFDHDLDFRNEYSYFADQGRKNGDTAVYDALLRDKPDDPPVSPKTGLLRNVAPIGSAIMWAPGFVLADLMVIIARVLGSSIPRDGYSWPYIYSVCYMSALYALFGLLLSYRLARRYAGAFAAAAATIAIWLATPLVFYTYILMPWSHTAGFFLFSLFLTIWLGPDDRRWAVDGGQEDGQQDEETRRAGDDLSAPRPFSPSPLLPHRRSLWRWGLLGVVAGLMALTREQLALLLIIPAAEGFIGYVRLARARRWRDAGQLLAGHALLLAAFVLTLVPQLLSYQTLYGQPRPSTVVSGKLKLCSPHMFDTLIDIDPAPDAHQQWCGLAVKTVYQALGLRFDQEGWYDASGVDRLKLMALSHGAFLWSPILLPALVGLYWLWRRNRMLTVLLLLGFFGQVYINGTISTWHLTRSFGFRRLIECTRAVELQQALLLRLAPADRGDSAVRGQAIGGASGLGQAIFRSAGHYEAHRALHTNAMARRDVDRFDAGARPQYHPYLLTTVE